MQALRMCGIARTNCKTLLQPYTSCRLLIPGRRNVISKISRTPSSSKFQPIVSRCLHTSRPLQVMDPAAMSQIGSLLLKLLLYFWKKQLRLYFADRPDLTRKFFRTMQDIFLFLLACALAQFIYYHEKIPVIDKWRYISPWADISSYTSMKELRGMKLRTVKYIDISSMYIHHHFKKLLIANADIDWIKENINLGTLHLVDVEMSIAASTVEQDIFVTRQQLRKLRDNDEVVGFLAHELAHLTLKHNEWLGSVDFFQTVMGYLASAAAWLCLKHEGVSLSVVIAIKYINMIRAEKILRICTTELEADKVGVKLAAKAGYNPEGLKYILARGASKGNQDKILQWPLPDHPPIYNRLRATDKYMDEAKDIWRKCRLYQVPRSTENSKRFIAKALTDILNEGKNKNYNCNENGTGSSKDGTCSKENGTCSKENGTCSKENGTCSNENGTCSKDGTCRNENSECNNENEYCSNKT